MKKSVFTAVMTVGMCMKRFCMRKISCAQISDMFSFSEVTLCSA